MAEPEGKLERYGRGEFLESLRAQLGLDSAPTLIRHNTNLIYDGGTYVIRLTPNSFRAADEVARELAWLGFVSRQTPAVVRLLDSFSPNPRQLEFHGEAFTVTVFEKVDGVPIPDEHWNEDHFQRLGALTGFLHRVSQRYVAPPGQELLAWDASPEASLSRNLPDDDRALPALVERTFEWLNRLPRAPETYGPIHYDIHQGNYLLAADGRIVLFDFENACLGHHLDDIAVAMFYARQHALSRNSANFDDTFLTAFWCGYKTQRPIPTQGLEQLPWFLLNRGLIVYAYLLKIWPSERNDAQRRYLELVEQGIAHERRVLGL
ncbi:MAG: phosphotransferase [Planctomycetota bacterium]